MGSFHSLNDILLKYGKKISGQKTSSKTQKDIIRIAIFASGAGSNAEKIISSSLQVAIGTLLKEKAEAEIRAGEKKYTVALIVCNKPGAGVLHIAEKAAIPSLLIEKERFYNGDNYLPELKKHEIDFIVLAGFLWKIPDTLIHAYPKKIINIHPALLPKHGGKGMYGNKVHESVLAAREKESGITIHYVDEKYDHGEIIFQETCPVDDNDTPESLAHKIHVLEHNHYPNVISGLLQKQNRS